MAVTLGTVTANTDTATTPFSFSHTHSGGSQDALVVVVFINSSQTATGVTYNSVALTLIDRTATATDGERIEMWRLLAPAAGANTVQVTLSSAASAVAIAVSLSGVHQTTPIGTAVTDAFTGSGTAHAHDTTCETDGLVLDAFLTHFGSGVVVTENGGQTSRYAGGSSGNFQAFLTSKPGATTTNTGYTWDSASANWVHITAPIMVAGALVAPWTVIGRTVLDYVD
jgi:hypothetical protein